MTHLNRNTTWIRLFYTYLQVPPVRIDNRYSNTAAWNTKVTRHFYFAIFSAILYTRKHRKTIPQWVKDFREEVRNMLNHSGNCLTKIQAALAHVREEL